MFIHSHIFHPLWNCIPPYVSCILMPLPQLLAWITGVIGVLRRSLGRLNAELTPQTEGIWITSPQKAWHQGLPHWHVEKKNCFWCFSLPLLLSFLFFLLFFFFFLDENCHTEISLLKTRGMKWRRNASVLPAWVFHTEPNVRLLRARVSFDAMRQNM